MKKGTYLNSIPVKAFTEWIEPTLDEPQGFVHSLALKRPKMQWTCSSLYSAYKAYQWPFKTFDPVTGETLSGVTLQNSTTVLAKLSKGLNDSINNGDDELCREYCFSVLKWGGVLAKNDKLVERLHREEGICNYLKRVRTLDLDTIDTDDDPHLLINSGFTKIYSE